MGKEHALRIPLRCSVAAWGVALAASVLATALAEDGVPPPSRTPAHVIVSGRTSTAQDIKTVAVGTLIPPTYTGARAKNAPGFSWFVSQHYALKTDYPPDKARFYLVLLELAYPHYVELFGAEPPGIAEKRMAAVYASSADKLKAALAADGIIWNFGGGGITFEGYRCSYIYPSGTLAYHQRYIALHECTHLFQMCVTGTVASTPPWYYEGIADSMGSHVYDSKKQQLTINVRDKPTTADFLDIGLADLRKKPMTLEEINEKGSDGRGVDFLAAHFFNDDPDRAQRFRLWRDAMFQAAPRGKAVAETSARLLQELFGPWSKLNAGFKAWADSLHNTFHYVEWGWEQESNTLWSYGFAEGGKLSQTDVFLIPNQKPEYDPFRMDYPAEPMPPLVGENLGRAKLPLSRPVERGVPEPVIGAVVDFSRCPGRGWAGIGLGLVPDEKSKCNCLKLLIEQGKQLILDGSDLGIAKKAVPLPDAFREAIKAGGHRVGITARIAKTTLEVTLRAGDPEKKLAEATASLPINDAQRERLLSNPLTLLSRDGWHGVTPYFDDRRRMEPDLSIPAPSNRWRNPGDKPLLALYRAGRDLGAVPEGTLKQELERGTPDKREEPRVPRPSSDLGVPGGLLPASLTALRARMLAAVTQDSEAQKQALAAFDSGLVRVLREVRQCKASQAKIAAALGHLTGLSLQLELASDAAPGHAQLTATLGGPLLGDAHGRIAFQAEPASALTVVPEPEEFQIKAGETLIIRRVYRLADARAPFVVRATAEVAWRGEKLTLAARREARPSIAGWWIIGPISNTGGETQDLAHPPEKEPIDLAKTYPGMGGKSVAWRQVLRDEGLDLAAEHIVDFNELLGPTEKADAYGFTWLDSPKDQDAVLALGSDDGVVVWLNGQRVHTNLVPRGYGSRSDLVPIRLKAGRNALLLKITQGTGDWCFAARIEDAEGNPLRTVTASPEERGPTKAVDGPAATR